MINLGLDSGNKSFYQNTTNGNIKAIYENGQIYLYNLADDVNANTNMVTIEGKNISVSDSGSITLANGLKNITINNETNAQLNVANKNFGLSTPTLNAITGTANDDTIDLTSITGKKADPITINAMAGNDGGEEACHLLIALVEHVFMVEPYTFLVVEPRTRLGALVQVEQPHQLVEREHFLVGAGVPSKQGEEIDDGLWEIAILTISCGHLPCLGVCPLQREHRESQPVAITL
jgi:hypothetical protein